MWKPILAGTTALVIAGSSLVYAQNRQGRPEGARRWQPNIEDMRALGDARLAGLKAGLALRTDQERNWPAFESAAREIQKLRLDRLSAAMEARRSQRPPAANPVERMQRRAGALVETGSALKKLADATGPLYNSLDDSQKRRFGILSRLDRPGNRGGQFRNRDGGPRGFDRGSRRTENQEFHHRIPTRGAPTSGAEDL
ncbi:MAG: hypothetical protein QOI12_5177 [Alphaproteobacteria bacterium]|jgi:hypothetical protein|nr:hypothetical protein [Alphaproteobacteria bacterium]